MDKTCETVTKPKNAKEYFLSSNFWKPALGVIIGGTLGYIYYAFEGCSSGTCAITSNPYLSILFGGFLGFSFVKRPCKTC